MGDDHVCHMCGEPAVWTFQAGDAVLSLCAKHVREIAEMLVEALEKYPSEPIGASDE